MPKQLAVLLLLLVGSIYPVQGLCKDEINAEDFTLSAEVKVVSSQQEVSGTSSQRHSNVDPACTVLSANDPRRERLNCDAEAASSTTISSSRSLTRFVVTAIIGDKVYDLRGPRIELATYRARFVNPSRRHPADVELLALDKKGKFLALGYRIAGERSKYSKP